MLSLLQTLEDNYNCRYNNFVVITTPRFPELPQIDELTFLGAFSYAFMKTKRRMLLREFIVNLGWGEQTPSEVARDYLLWKYPAKRRFSKVQAQDNWKHHSPPCYAVAGRWGDCAYFDLKGAYWAIMNTVGWDVDYHFGNWLGVGVPPSDFPLGFNKLARNCLVSAALNGEKRVWTGSKLITKKAYNKNLNMGLWACVQDILHGIACDMVKAGALYVNTDGYIMPVKRYQLAHEVLQSWGLPYGIKGMGETEIFGVGCYQVGGMRTKQKGYRGYNPYESIEKKDYNWLRNRVRFLRNELDV
jgi:hypothetical protein